MVNFIDGVFFFYVFLGLYMTSLFVFIYLGNRRTLWEYPKGKPEPVSIVMPCFNAEKTIGKGIESLLKLDYPKKMLEIIVVDDKSTDNSVKVIERYVKKYRNVRLIKHKENCGNAAGTTNTGVKAAKYKYIAVADDDSTPDRDALIKMIGFLQEDKKVGAVTCSILTQHQKTIFQKLQDLEYGVIAFTRKLLDSVDSVYVTPGPFALYRRKDLIKVGLFDVNNMTQDIEIVWRLLSHGYIARMCLDTNVYSDTPEKFGAWWKQRIRWNIGGQQTLWKHKGLIFKKGMLGTFIIPLFAASLFLGLFGFGLFVYLMARRFISTYLSTTYSVYANTAVLRMQDLSFTPSVLNFFGIVLFVVGLCFTLFCLGSMRGRRKGSMNFFLIMIYSLFYLSIYPINLLISIYKLSTGRYSW